MALRPRGNAAILAHDAALGLRAAIVSAGAVPATTYIPLAANSPLTPVYAGPASPTITTPLPSVTQYNPPTILAPNNVIQTQWGPQMASPIAETYYHIQRGANGSYFKTPVTNDIRGTPIYIPPVAAGTYAAYVPALTHQSSAIPTLPQQEYVMPMITDKITGIATYLPSHYNVPVTNAELAQAAWAKAATVNYSPSGVSSAYDRGLSVDNSYLAPLTHQTSTIPDKITAPVVYYAAPAANAQYYANSSNAPAPVGYVLPSVTYAAPNYAQQSQGAHNMPMNYNSPLTGGGTLQTAAGGGQVTVTQGADNTQPTYVANYGGIFGTGQGGLFAGMSPIMLVGGDPVALSVEKALGNGEIVYQFYEIDLPSWDEFVASYDAWAVDYFNLLAQLKSQRAIVVQNFPNELASFDTLITDATNSAATLRELGTIRDNVVQWMNSIGQNTSNFAATIKGVYNDISAGISEAWNWSLGELGVPSGTLHGLGLKRGLGQAQIVIGVAVALASLAAIYWRYSVMQEWAQRIALVNAYRQQGMTLQEALSAVNNELGPAPGNDTFSTALNSIANQPWLPITLAIAAIYLVPPLLKEFGK